MTNANTMVATIVVRAIVDGAAGGAAGRSQWDSVAVSAEEAGDYQDQKQFKGEYEC